MTAETNESITTINPSPLEFDLYLPWACLQLRLDAMVRVTKTQQHEYIDRSKKGKPTKGGKATYSVQENMADQDKEHTSENVSAADKEQLNDVAKGWKIVKVLATYDNLGNLVQIKFDKNKQLPRKLFKIIGLIIQFQHHLNAITIHGAIDCYTIYEISKFLPASHITEICLDGCRLKIPNYNLLLEKPNLLKNLSLCRCNIDDITIESIFSLLIYPLPASKTLSILNLSSNRITDEGAKFIGITLRSNRQICYLNLASNMITDIGATLILNSLLVFPLTIDEKLASKLRCMTFLRNKNDLISNTYKELMLDDSNKKLQKRKSLKICTSKKLKTDCPTNNDNNNIADWVSKNRSEIDDTLMEKASMTVQMLVGDFNDPFNDSNTFIRNSVTYCNGNNALCCLNLSFNSLSYFTLEKVNAVLLHQNLEERKPCGLLRILVDGNYMPIACMELSKIESILMFKLNLAVQSRTNYAWKKKSVMKHTPITMSDR